MSNKLTNKANAVIHKNICTTLSALSRLKSALSLDRPPTTEEWNTWVDTCREITAEATDAASEACDWSEALVAEAGK
jgi:hypothetical protein